MYIARIRIQNYRCFRDTTIEFQPGLNVIIGENNSGKTTLLKALAVVFDRRGRSRPTVHDFHCLLEPIDSPPCITVGVTISSSDNVTQADQAVVATWLTKVESPWEAQLTYKFFLPEKHKAEFAAALNGSAGREGFFEVVAEFLPKYVTRIYGGNPSTMLVADAEMLSKFDCQFLDALRDVESEMFAGGTPLFRAMLREVLDLGAQPAKKRELRRTFRLRSNTLRDGLVKRLSTEKLFKLVKATGAADGGHPKLHGGVEESDLIAALRLFISRKEFEFPATHQGLGYNNLLYMSLLLASMSFRASEERRGENAAVFPMLLIEEPEAHLHPALQHKLLSHIVERVEAEPQYNRQIFVTTHSTHVTSAAGLGPIICLSIRQNGGIGVSYPAKVFSGDANGQESRAYVDRYLDATKSTMLFAKAVVLVEGVAEQIVVPALAAMMKRSFDQYHVAIVRVDGVTFKHFLPLFGAGVPVDKEAFCLDRRIACIVDADPARKKKGLENARWKACFPFQRKGDSKNFEYRSVSGVVSNLRDLARTRSNIKVVCGLKTFEYDLAFVNHSCSNLVTSAMKNGSELRKFIANHNHLSPALEVVLKDDEHKALKAFKSANRYCRHKVAAVYLRCAEECKGEHAFALAQAVRESLGDSGVVKCPRHIRQAIEWVTPPMEQWETSV